MPQQVVGYAITPQDTISMLALTFSKAVAPILRRDIKELEPMTAGVVTPHIIDKLIQIPGLERLEVTPHTIFVAKAMLVDWTGILNPLLVAVIDYYNETSAPQTHALAFVPDDARTEWISGVIEQQKCWLQYGQGVDPAGNQGEMVAPVDDNITDISSKRPPKKTRVQ